MELVDGELSSRLILEGGLEGEVEEEREGLIGKENFYSMRSCIWLSWSDMGKWCVQLIIIRFKALFYRLSFKLRAPQSSEGCF